MTGKTSPATKGNAPVGQGEFQYLPDANWARRPPGYTWTEVAGVACDSADRVYVFNRGDHPLMVFDREGAFLRSFAEGQFQRPHGITIGPDDAIYCTDDVGHVVKKFSPEGELLLTLGTGSPSDTGATSMDFRTIQRAGPPFHYPTNVALSPQGEMYVADGYGNARVHKFSPDGKYLFSWGEPGDAAGQFRIPHGIAVDADGNVHVADRENSRLLVFSPRGKPLDQWLEIARPCQVALDGQGRRFVAELGYRAGMWPGISPPGPMATGGRVSILDPDGQVLSRFGGGENPTAAGDFYAPHDICFDSRGDLYVCEVVWSAGGSRGLVSADCHALQKFTRVRG